MNVKRFLFATLATLLAFAWVSPAQAVVLTFYTELSYNAAVGSELFAINFDGLSGYGSGNFAGQVDFGSPEASDPSQVYFASDAMSDAGSTTAPNNVGPVNGVFASAVNAFGLEFSSSSNSQTIVLYDASSSLIGSVSSNPGGFFGVYSDVAIGSFEIINGTFPDGSPDRFFVDNFRANAAVPEPGTIFLLGTGIMGLGAAYRRRKRA